MKDNINSILYFMILLAVISTVSDLLIAHSVDSIRQDIVELKKEFSYDPKDAK